MTGLLVVIQLTVLMLKFLSLLLIIKNITVMNKEQLDAIRLYCKLTFGTTDVGVTKAIDCIDEDAFDAGLTRLQYIDYLTVNGFKP